MFYSGISATKRLVDIKRDRNIKILALKMAHDLNFLVIVKINERA
jgi:hypothetical protein